jgi:hypothetical protein
MLNTNTQMHFAEATAELFDFYARSGTRFAWASADRGMALWLGALQIAAKRADARLNEWRGAFVPWMDLNASFAPRSAEKPAQARPASEPAYASYRTAGGHAAAQVIITGNPA